MKQTPSRAGKVAVRLFIASIAILALGGPSPGHVGSCDGSAERTPYIEFCVQRSTANCERDLAATRIDAEQYGVCSTNVMPGCEGGNYAPCNGVETAPSTTQTDACVAALRDPGRFGLLESELAECRFCPGGV